MHLRSVYASQTEDPVCQSAWDFRGTCLSSWQQAMTAEAINGATPVLKKALIERR